MIPRSANCFKKYIVLPLFISAFLFGVIVWYAHRYDTKKDKDKNKINDEDVV